MARRLPLGRQGLPGQELLLRGGGAALPAGLPALRHESQEEPPQDQDVSAAFVEDDGQTAEQVQLTLNYNMRHQL